MRVISGEAKGLSLKWPKEPHIRPTADRVREAIFSAIESLDADWSCVLDLYAGTGALGIEALSRGAQKADFVEKNTKCCAVIRENLKHTNLSNMANIYRMDARKALETLPKNQYSLIFLDPPYADKNISDILAGIVSSGIAKNRAVVVVEHSHKSALAEGFYGFKMIKSLHHGDTGVSIFQCEGGRN